MADKKEVSSFILIPRYKLLKIAELVSHVLLDELKLDCFNLYHTNTPWISKYSLQADRIRMKAAYDAKEADKVRRRQQYVQRKEGKLPVQF